MFFARRYRIHPPRNCPHDKLNIIISYDIYFSFSDYFGDNLGGDYIPSYGYWRLSLVLFCLDTLSFCPTARKGAKTLRFATALYSPNFKLPFFWVSLLVLTVCNRPRKTSTPRSWPFSVSTLKGSNSLFFKLAIYFLTQLPFLTSYINTCFCSLILWWVLIIKIMVITDYPLTHMHKDTKHI